MKRLLPLLMLFALFAPAHVWAELNFITLHHRSAEELVPMLQPVVDDDIRISGRGSTLIVNSKPWQLEEVRSLVERLDTPLHSLLISVKQGDEERRSALHGSVTGTLDQPHVRLYGTNKRAKEAVSQQLRIIEGGWATISAGEAIPLASQTTTQSPFGATTQQSIEYKNVQSGFEVRPRINGERVILEVRPFRAKRAKTGAGIIEQQEIVTTVSGKLGEWIDIGGVDEQTHDSGVGTVYATGKNRNATHNVRLKVELLPN